MKFEKNNNVWLLIIWISSFSLKFNIFDFTNIKSTARFDFKNKKWRSVSVMEMFIIDINPIDSESKYSSWTVLNMCPYFEWDSPYILFSSVFQNNQIVIYIIYKTNTKCQTKNALYNVLYILECVGFCDFTTS